MTRHPVPKGVSLDTLREIIVGWAAVGAAVEPCNTADVADATDIADTVGRQTRFLEAVGLLERCGQQHRLTDDGQTVAGALMADDEAVAVDRFRAVLSDWALTTAVRGVLRDNAMAADSLVPVVAALAGVDADSDRISSGLTTLLDLYEWTGVLDCDADGRYHLPDGAAGESPDAGADADADADADTISAAQLLAGDGGAVDGALVDELLGGSDATDVSVAAADHEMAGREHPARSGESHALSLAVDVDADAADLEAIVAAIRRGLTAESDDEN